MPTVQELVDRVQNLYSKGIPSQQTRLRPRSIYSTYKSKAAKVLEQRLNKKQAVGDLQYTFLCVELEKVPIQECIALVGKGCEIWRSKCNLPSPIVSRSKQEIESVTSVDSNIEFNPSMWSSFKYSKHDTYTPNSPQYFLRNNKIYVTGNVDAITGNAIEYILVSVLVEDPVAALQFCNTNIQGEAECFDPFAVSLNLTGQDYDNAVILTIEELIGIFTKNKEDISHDAKDSRTSEGK